MRRVGDAVLAAGLMIMFSSCSASSMDEPQGAAAPPADYRAGRGSGVGSAASQREQQAAFLQRIRSSDPQFQTIERALFNERNELGVVLDRGVEMDAIPGMMRALLTQMAREFPGEDLTIIAYAPTQPPARIGVARLDSRTRQMSYTADRQQ